MLSKWSPNLNASRSTSAFGLSGVPWCSVKTLLLATVFSLGAQAADAAQTINVKTYGAKGDGTTDDQVAIQNAFNAAAAKHATVLFPSGNYLHSGNLCANGIVITSNSATLTATNSSSPSLVLKGTSSVSNLNLTSNVSLGPTESQALVDIALLSNKCKVTQCSISGPISIGIYCAGPNATIKQCNLTSGNRGAYTVVANSDRTLVTNCYFRTITGSTHSFIAGVAVGKATNTTISQNTFTNISFAVLTGDDKFGAPINTLLIDRNTMSSVGSGVQFYGPNSDPNPRVTNVTITNNTITGSSNDSSDTAGINSETVMLKGLIANNTITNFELPGILSSNTITEFQITNNTITNCSSAVRIGQARSSIIRNNSIANIKREGIFVSQSRTFLTIEQNSIRNCGLDEANAIIFIGGSSTPGGNIRIAYNAYAGNQNNVDYFILSVPPATLTGNATSTSLPSAVGNI